MREPKKKNHQLYRSLRCLSNLQIPEINSKDQVLTSVAFITAGQATPPGPRTPPEIRPS